MSKFTENDYHAFRQDLDLLVETLKKSFEVEEINPFYDDDRNTLYLQIKGLQEFDDDEIQEIANPVFDELDLDFDEIILLPLS